MSDSEATETERNGGDTDDDSALHWMSVNPLTGNLRASELPNSVIDRDFSPEFKLIY
jgi:hypothetical protein